MTDNNLALVVQLLTDEAEKSKTIGNIKEVGKTEDEAFKNIADWNKTTIEQAKEMNRLAGLANEKRKQAVALEQQLVNQTRAKKKLQDEATKVTKTNGDQNKILADNAVAQKKESDAVHAKWAAESVAFQQEKKQAEDKKKRDAESLAQSKAMKQAEEERNRASQQAADERKSTEEAEQKRQRQMAAAVQEEMKAYHEDLRQVTILRRQAASLMNVGRGLTIGGTLVTGGMYALANKEVNRQKETGQVTAETQRWLDAQLRVEKATERISRTFITAILPTLEKVSALAERASKYLESHPEIAKTVFNAAAIVVEVSTGNVLAYVGNTEVKERGHYGDAVDVITSPRSTPASVTNRSSPFLFPTAST